MKIPKKLEPIVTGISSSIMIGVLAFLSFETSTGFWLMISFGATSLIVFALYDKEFAQPGNIFFGHLLGITVGILFNEFIGISFISLALSVGFTVTLMIYLKVVHPPAAANPLIALFSDVSFEYIIFPVITGTLIIIIISVVINRLILKRNYPTRWF
jgi:CBS-domain-containing membrane protein|tara:strand:- start:286 stop:756 length:471 start_codon:yes stop_codon:yes gene_type:complete